jgi:hypothetical protein
VKRGSFESINYSLRPNKNVERKLIVSSLQRVAQRFPLTEYRYVGFGSMWFTDFSLFHRHLGISDMVTIERVVSRKKRVEFNKPYSCIEVVMGDASAVLGDIVEAKRSLVWLDYDGGLSSATSGDVEIAVGAMTSGSMIMLSVNAMIEQLNVKDDDENPVEPIDCLVEITGRAGLASEANRLTRRDFPNLVADILHERIRSAALSRPGFAYQPIWNFLYADGAEMITVGGMIVDEVDTQLLVDCELGELPFLMTPLPFEIRLPMLTDKEKRELDRRMPRQDPIRASDLPFELRDTELEAYRKFYLEYPLYGEIAA